MAEGGIRLLHLAPEVTRIEIHTPWAAFVPSDDPILLYEPKPGAGDINEYGARDFPFRVAKPSGTFRIVVLGDSIAFGYCNDREALAVKDTFPKVLERSLRQRLGPGIEVLNLSVSGYDTRQEAEMLARKGIPLSPDLVVVAYCLNDSWEMSAEWFGFEESGFGGVLGSSAAFRRLYLDSHLVRFVMQRGAIVRRGLRWLRKNPAEDRTREGFRRIAALGAEHGFQTVVAAFPTFEGYDPYPREAEHRTVAEKAGAEGLPFLDLLPAFREASQGNAHALQGRCVREHPDEHGHAVAAGALETYLIGHHLIGEKRPDP